MIITRRGLKVKVMSQASAVGPTSIEGSFFLVYVLRYAEIPCADLLRLLMCPFPRLTTTRVNK